MMAKGLTEEEIKAEWVRRFGTAGAHGARPTAGANRLLYIAPLAVIAGMGGVRGARAPPLPRGAVRRAGRGRRGPPLPRRKRDEYDDKLDEELKQLDDE